MLLGVRALLIGVRASSLRGSLLSGSSSEFGIGSFEPQSPPVSYGASINWSSTVSRGGSFELQAPLS